MTRDIHLIMGILLREQKNMKCDQNYGEVGCKHYTLTNRWFRSLFNAKAPYYSDWIIEFKKKIVRE